MPTNQKKGIVTRGSGHIAESVGVSLPYFAKGMAGPTVMDDNHIATAKCAVAMAAQRTFVEKSHVLHHQSLIGHPYGDGGTTGFMSIYDRPHGNAANNPPVFGWFAIPDKKSPDTMVEGKWIVRTFDKTIQDVTNGPGRFSPGANSTEILDESQLLFQQCAVEKIELACKHDGRKTMDGELHVFIGDEVTVTAYRVNASETDEARRLDVHCHFATYKQKEKPPAEETKHAAFVIRRNGRVVTPKLFWTQIPPKTLVGTDGAAGAKGAKKKQKTSVLVLKEEWLLKSDSAEEEQQAEGGPKTSSGEVSVGGLGTSYDTNDMREDSRTSGNERYGQVGLQNQVGSAERRLASAQAAPGRRGRRSGAVGATRAQVRGAENAVDRYDQSAGARAENAKQSKSLRGQARLGADTFQIVMEYFLFEPLRLDIEAHGCSPGASAVVKAFPREEMGAELAVLKDFSFTKTVSNMKTLVSKISDFIGKVMKGTSLREFGPSPLLGQKSAFSIDLYFFRHKKNLGTGEKSVEQDLEPSIELGLSWKELTRESRPEDGEKKGLKPWQVNRAWKVEVKLERLLGLTINFEIDLNACLGFGKVITDVLKFCGVKTGVFFDIDFDLSAGVSGTVGQDEYGKWDLNSPAVAIKSVLKLSLIAKAGRFFEAKIVLAGRWEPKLFLGYNAKDQFCLQRTQSVFQVLLTLEAKIDIFGWDLDAVYVIKKWDFEIPGSDVPILGQGA